MCWAGLGSGEASRGPWFDRKATHRDLPARVRVAEAIAFWLDKCGDQINRDSYDEQTMIEWLEFDGRHSDIPFEDKIKISWTSSAEVRGNNGWKMGLGACAFAAVTSAACLPPPTRDRGD